MLLLQFLNVIYFLLPIFGEKYYYKPKICKNINTIALYSYFSSTIHSFIMSTYSILYLTDYMDDTILKSLFPYSILYFISDLWLICLTDYFNKNKYNFIIHHLITFLGYFLYYNKTYDNKISSINTLSQLLVSEFCIVPLNICWFLIKLNKKETILFVYLKYFTGASYFLFRIVNLTHLLYYFYVKKILLLIVMQIFIVGFNYMWFYRLVFT